jgi:hypothetical protein
VDKDEQRLPVIQDDLDGEVPSCSPTIYVSNEEVALLAGMRELRERSIELKMQMKSADTGRRSSLESEIEELRTQWKELAAQREKAFVRKMIMLGHLPPNHPTE